MDIVRKLRLHPNDVGRVLEQAARLSTPWPADCTLPGGQRASGSGGAPDHELDAENRIVAATGIDAARDVVHDCESERLVPGGSARDSASGSADGASGSGPAGSTCPTGNAVSGEFPPPRDGDDGRSEIVTDPAVASAQTLAITPHAPSAEVDHRDLTDASRGDASGAASRTIGSDPDRHADAQAMADRHTQDLHDFLQILREAAALKAW